MNIKFDEEDIYNLIIDIEDKYRNEIKESGNESWPITKISIYTSLTKLSYQSKNKSIFSSELGGKSYYNLIENIKDFIFRCLISKLRLINKKKKINNLFFSRTLYLEKVNSKIIFDRIVDPLYLTSLVNTESLKMYVDRYWKHNNLFLKGIFYNNKNLFNKFLEKNIKYKKEKLNNNCNNLLNLFIKLHGLESLSHILKVDLENDIKNYLSCKNKAKNFLKKFPNLKKVFVVCWYSPDMMAIVAAANELQKETIEIQHGKQGRYQPAYSGWKCASDLEFTNLPKYFWCWGKEGIKNILNGSEKRNHHLPILGGYAWPKLYKEFIKKRTITSSNSRIKLLFTMQAFVATNNEPFTNGLLKILKHYDELYKKGYKNEFELRVRLHPNKVEFSIGYLKERLGDLFFSNLVEVSSKLDSCLYDDLSWANHHITCFSTSVIESISFNIKSAVYGNFAYKLYSEEIKNSSLSHLKNCTFQELKDWLNSEDNIEKRETNYILNKLPDPKLLIQPIDKLKNIG